ncbi:DoxX family protein [Aureivirga marina]|uniref:DoxX family protein n=1 Tax=Aureivirga marina TaxID=1182451 RepID=UPI0018C9E3E0|nr:DoxX family protein [Aureivirga marina]
MKKYKIIYWIFTSFLCLQLLISVGFYFFETTFMKQMIIALEFPAYLVIPMGIAKLLAVIAIFTGFHKTIKEWAYAGLFYNLLLAVSAHINKGDNEYLGALISLVFLIGSYVFWILNKRKCNLVVIK